VASGLPFLLFLDSRCLLPLPGLLTPSLARIPVPSILCLTYSIWTDCQYLWPQKPSGIYQGSRCKAREFQALCGLLCTVLVLVSLLKAAEMDVILGPFLGARLLSHLSSVPLAPLPPTEHRSHYKAALFVLVNCILSTASSHETLAKCTLKEVSESPFLKRV
jgi:hypothetical protein